MASAAESTATMTAATESTATVASAKRTAYACATATVSERTTAEAWSAAVHASSERRAAAVAAATVTERAVGCALCGRVAERRAVGALLHVAERLVLSVRSSLAEAVACNGSACAALALHVAERLSASEVATVETVSHTRSAFSGAWTAEVTSVIPASATVHVPAVCTVVHGIEGGASEEEIVAARVSGVDAEVPVASVPVERAVEVTGFYISAVLPVQKDVAQVQVALSPVCAVQVVIAVDAHQVVEVHLVCCFVLFVGKVQFVSHLVCQEEGLLASLFVAHCRCGSYCYCEQCYHSYYKLLHSCIVYRLSIRFFHDAKIEQNIGHRKGFSLKG